MRLFRWRHEYRIGNCWLRSNSGISKLDSRQRSSLLFQRTHKQVVLSQAIPKRCAGDVQNVTVGIRLRGLHLHATITRPFLCTSLHRSPAAPLSPKHSFAIPLLSDTRNGTYSGQDQK
eukprot:5594823-Amphidinium_carterae.1